MRTLASSHQPAIWPAGSNLLYVWKQGRNSSIAIIQTYCSEQLFQNYYYLLPELLFRNSAVSGLESGTSGSELKSLSTRPMIRRHL